MGATLPRSREVGLLPSGAQVREVQTRVHALRACIGECDAGIGVAEAQLERLRMEASETKRQLQVVEADLSAFHTRSITSSGVEAGFLALTRDLAGRAVLLQHVRASLARPVSAETGPAAAAAAASSASEPAGAAGDSTMALVSIEAATGHAAAGIVVDLVGEPVARQGKGPGAETGRGCGDPESGEDGRRVSARRAEANARR